MPTWKRAIQILFVATASLAVLYLAGGNLFLKLGLPRILDKPSLILGYASAWTVWPGRVHVRDFHVQGQSDTVEWQLAVAHGTVDVDLWALTHREVHLHDVHADGLRFRFRLGVMPGDAEDPKVRALPPIPPYADPPIRLAGALGPELIRGEYRHWVTRIDDSDAEVEEIWVGPYRFEGRARSHGGFHIAAHRAVAISPATLDMSDGVLTIAEHEMARGVEGRVTCTVDAFNPDELPGREMLRAFSSDVKLDAEVPSLAFLQFWVPEASARFEGGGGPMHVDAKLRHGRLENESVLQLTNDKLHLRTPAFAIVADGKLEWRTRDDDARTVVHTLISEATIERLGVEVAPVKISDATADYTTLDGDLAEGLGFAGLSSKLPRATGDIRWITKVRAAEPVRFEAGRVTLSGDLEVDRAFHVTSHARGTLHGIALRVKDSHLHGDLLATASVSGADVIHTRRVTVDGGTATLSPASVTRDGDRTALTARADLEGGELDFRNGFELKLSSHAQTNGTGAVLDLVGAPRLAKAAAALFGSTTATASAKMAYQGNLFSLTIAKGSSGITHVKGEVRTKGKAVEAAFVVRADPFSLGILLEGGHVQTAPEPGDKWLDEHRPKLTPDERHPAAVAERVR